MDERLHYLAIYHIKQEKALKVMREWLEEHDYNYREFDNRFNETTIDVLNSNDLKVGVGSLVNSKPQISIYVGEEIEYQGEEITVTEQEIKAFYER